jgi:hypothetical protein
MAPRSLHPMRFYSCQLAFAMRPFTIARMTISGTPAGRLESRSYSMCCIEHGLPRLIRYLPIMANGWGSRQRQSPEQRLPFQSPELRKRKRRKLFPERLFVPNRNLRVTKWLGTVPAVGVCTSCNREFKAAMTAMKRVADAQESLRLQFTEHKCKGEMASESASSGN